MFVAIVDGEILSARKSEERALKDILEYRDMKPSEIKQLIKDKVDITSIDSGCKIVETIRD